MSKRGETFRELVEAASRSGLSDTDRPHPMAVLAKACGFSRQHLNRLMAGRSSGHGTGTEPAEWRVQAIAKGLGVPAKRVRDALKRSRLAAARARTVRPPRKRGRPAKGAS